MRKEEEIERALAAYRAAVEYAHSHRPADNALSRNQDGPVTSPKPSSPVALRGPRPNVPIRNSITEYYDFASMQFIKCINSDGHPRIDDEIIDELVPKLGFARRSARIEAVMRYLLDRVRSQSTPPL